MFYISNVHENVLYLIGVWKTDGKTWWKNLTALLAEICQPGPAQITLDEEDSRACEGGRSRERDWDVICIQATFQGAVSFPSPCLCFRGLLDTKALSRHLHEIFNRYWPVSRNMSVASSPPCLALISSQIRRGACQVKWHRIFSLRGKVPSYWNSSAYGVLPQSFLDFTVQGLVFGCLEWHLFSPKEILSGVFVWGSDWERTWPWSAPHVIRDPSW